MDPAPAAATLAAGESPLTACERDVLVAARSGATVAEVAAWLYLAEGTVRNYLSGAATKTGTRNRMEALRVADERAGCDAVRRLALPSARPDSPRCRHQRAHCSQIGSQSRQGSAILVASPAVRPAWMLRSHRSTDRGVPEQRVGGPLPERLGYDRVRSRSIRLYAAGRGP